MESLGVTQKKGPVIKEAFLREEVRPGNMINIMDYRDDRGDADKPG
jgi:hypothetical protein